MVVEVVPTVTVVEVILNLQTHIVEESTIPSVRIFIGQLDGKGTEQLLCCRLRGKCRQQLQAFNSRFPVRTAKGVQGFLFIHVHGHRFFLLVLDKIKAADTSQWKYLSLYVQYEIVGSGLEKITQIAVDNGYSDNQPFGYVWDDKGHKTDCQHPDCLCSCAYPHQPADNR